MQQSYVFLIFQNPSTNWLLNIQITSLCESLSFKPSQIYACYIHILRELNSCFFFKTGCQVFHAVLEQPRMNDLELLILLHLPSECWGCRTVPPCLVNVVCQALYQLSSILSHILLKFFSTLFMSPLSAVPLF